MIEGDLQELMPVLEPAVLDDVPHVNPHDRHADICWLWEAPVTPGNVLTYDGVTQIAYHKYVSGSSTALDLALNSTWQYLTDLLPMHIAPNMVTTLGGLHCILAYVVTWHYTENFSSAVPDWVLLLNAYCSAVYYTLDCMDGKQARRTGTSSPLGQLFDHGIDCFCLQQHISMCMAWLVMPDSKWLWASQAGLQFSFFMAQWEEYYTGVLPHATGNLGVTEVNYGLAVFSFVNAFMPDRAALYSRAVSDLVPPTIFNNAIKPALEWIGIDAAGFQLKHALTMGWYLMCTVLGTLCLIRVVSSQIVAKQSVVAAVSKLISPAVLCMAPFAVDSTILQRETRWFSLAFGLALTHITIKLIVFSMARQAVAAMQFADVLPLALACLWVRYDARWKEPGIHLLLQVLTITYGIRIVLWTKAAVRQLCDRLDIHLLTIKPKVKKS